MVFLCLWIICYIITTIKGIEEAGKYTNIWLSKIHGGEKVAERVARDLGFTYKGQASHFKDHYVLMKDDQPKYSADSGDRFTRDLLDFDEVKWANQQTLVERVVGSYGVDWEQGGLKREDDQDRYTSRFWNFFGGDEDLQGLSKFTTKPLDDSYLYKQKGVTNNIGLKSNKFSYYAKRFNDPNWSKQWYMQDYRTREMPVMDHNIVPVWNMGIFGKSVTVAILDVGVQHNHPDLKENFEKSLSYDVVDDEPGCMPKKDGYGVNAKYKYHGTSCAGVVAMVPNNRLCGVGIAYKSKVAGIRMLGQELTTFMIAKALTHALNKIDIYSNSWVPHPTGYYQCELEHIELEAYIKGVTEGRDKKGAIYVQTNGNGRSDGNNCAANCYVNHPYAITIASANQNGRATKYSERCPGIFATAYSGDKDMEGITTLDGNTGCLTLFTGRSEANPVATGIIALVLDSKPELTYRDVMHLIAMTAEVAPLADNQKTWHKNGIGLWVSHDFGFGLLNAENMVILAQDWVTVPERHTCTVTVMFDEPRTVKVEQERVMSFETDACMTSETEAVNFLEHIEVMVDVQTKLARGTLMLDIKSPLGTVTKLLEPRVHDVIEKGIKWWNIMSVHNWGEDPKGVWELTLKVGNDVYNVPGMLAYINGFTVQFHGTAEKPQHYNTKRKYAAFRLPDGRTSLDSGTFDVL